MWISRQTRHFSRNIKSMVFLLWFISNRESKLSMKVPGNFRFFIFGYIKKQLTLSFLLVLISWQPLRLMGESILFFMVILTALKLKFSRKFPLLMTLICTIRSNLHKNLMIPSKFLDRSPRAFRTMWLTGTLKTGLLCLIDLLSIRSMIELVERFFRIKEMRSFYLFLMDRMARRSDKLCLQLLLTGKFTWNEGWFSLKYKGQKRNRLMAFQTIWR